MACVGRKESGGPANWSFDTAANSVTPVPPEPTSVDVINAALGAPDIQQQVSNYLSAAQHKRRLYTAYHGASQYKHHQPPHGYGHLAVDNASVITTEPTVSTPMSVALAAPAGRAAPRTVSSPTSPRNHFRQCRRAKPIAARTRHCSARTSSGDRADLSRSATDDAIGCHRTRSGRAWHRGISTGNTVAMEPTEYWPVRAVWARV